MRFVVIVLSILFATQAFAASDFDLCDYHPEDTTKCTDDMLCRLATFSNYGKIEWTPIDQMFVDTAMDRGLECGVTETLCFYHAGSCNDTELCEKATIESRGPDWVPNNTKHYLEARKRGLTCNVRKSMDAERACRGNPEISHCTDDKLCWNATKIVDGVTTWVSGKDFDGWARYVNAAKKRGLNCGVVEKLPKVKQPSSSREYFSQDCSKKHLTLRDLGVQLNWIRPFNSNINECMRLGDTLIVAFKDGSELRYWPDQNFISLHVPPYHKKYRQIAECLDTKTRKKFRPRSPINCR